MYDLRNNFSFYYDFYIVAKEGGFNKAADVNYISQPTLSRNIKKLESDMNIVLFNRYTTGIELTKSGKKLYKTLDTVFNLLKKSDITNNTEDFVEEIVIGTTNNIANILLKDKLLLFYNKYPHIKLKIVISDAKDLSKQLYNHDIDVLIDYLPFTVEKEKSLVFVENIGHFETCFACSKNFYSNNIEAYFSINDLSKYNLVLPGESRRRQILNEFFKSKKITINPIIEMPNNKLMKSIILNDFGIGYFLKEDVKAELGESLVEIKLNDDLPTNPVGIIYLKDYLDLKTMNFISLFQDKEEE